MKVLIVKTSSMGDIIHTLPALSDAQKAMPEIQFDWLVEDAFAEIPTWHPAVNKVISIKFRQLRKKPLLLPFKLAWKTFKRNLQQTHYDIIIDAQGLLKSVFLAKKARGILHGYDKQSIKESLAAYFYGVKRTISKEQHAINRARELFSKSLGYDYSSFDMDYGIKQSIDESASKDKFEKQYIILLTNTSQQSKHWSIEGWRSLLAKLRDSNLVAIMPSGSDKEYQMTCLIAEGFDNAIALQRQPLLDTAHLISKSVAVVSVDTGLAHLSAALDKSTITLYGPTNPDKIGTMGRQQVHLHSTGSITTNHQLPQLNPGIIFEKLHEFI